MPSTNLAPYPLTFTTLSTPLLASSPHLSTLYTLINRAFSHSHRTGHRTIVLNEQRLQAPAQLIEEIGPDGFCILAFSIPDGENEESRLIGTASAKPYSAPLPGEGMEGSGGGMMSEVNKMFKRTQTELPIPPLPTTDASNHPEVGEEEEEDLPSWEILAMAVVPELQGRGIASQLLGLTIETIRERVKTEQRFSIEDRDGKEEDRVKILLSTL